MTQQTVAIHFTYVVGGETKEGSTEVRARVEDVESKEGWQRMVTWLVFRAIGEAEPELILKTPNGWYGNMKGFAAPQSPATSMFPNPPPETPPCFAQVWGFNRGKYPQVISHRGLSVCRWIV